MYSAWTGEPAHSVRKHSLKGFRIRPEMEIAQPQKDALTRADKACPGSLSQVGREEGQLVAGLKDSVQRRRLQAQGPAA